MTDVVTSYDHLPEPPAEAPHAAAVLARLVDGLAFRYRWATDGLDAELLAFRPCDGWNLGELLDHLRFLARWMAQNAAAARHGTALVTYPEACADLPDPSGDPGLYVEQTLTALVSLRTDLLALGDDGLNTIRLIGGNEPSEWPVWNMLNGPLADALTHVGQVSSWRKLAGSPAPRHDVFRGRPPKGHVAG